MVLINWSWRYLSWGSGPRVIVGDDLGSTRGPRPALTPRFAEPSAPRRLIAPVGQGYGERVDDILEQIDRKVLQLFALVGESVAGATDALLSGDREAAKALADRDEVVDTLYHDIEQLTLEQLTVAGITSPEDLRFLVTVIRMLPDLERNGDLAEHVARRAARGLGGELSARSRGLVERMGEVAIHMWRATTDAYAERQPDGGLGAWTPSTTRWTTSTSASRWRWWRDHAPAGGRGAGHGGPLLRAVRRPCRQPGQAGGRASCPRPAPTH